MTNLTVNSMEKNFQLHHNEKHQATAVYLSGGIDSAIVLYHLTKLAEKENRKIFTYTANFGLKKDECKQANRIAKYFKSIHKEIKIDNLQKKLPEILPLFDKPRFNVWPYYLAEAAKKDNCKWIYIGEGSDEVFGGYETKGYLEAWADSIIYIMSTYKVIHKHFDLELFAPFMDLDWTDFLDYHLNPTKPFLRSAYKDLLPKFIVEMKSEPPVYTDYIALGKKEFSEYFKKTPANQTEARKKINKIITYLWLQYQK